MWNEHRIVNSILKIQIKKEKKKNFTGFPWWLSGKESTSQCRRYGFDPWSGKIPHVVEQPSFYAATTEPVLWSLGAATTEAHEPRACGLQQEKP